MTNVTTSTTHKANLHELQGEFLEFLKVQGKSNNTLKNYKTDLECFNQFLLQKQNSLELEEFGITKVMEYSSYLQSRYTSDNSLRRRAQALRIFFDFLVNKGILSENSVRKMPTSPKFLDIPHPTTFVDINKVWSHLKEQSEKALIASPDDSKQPQTKKSLERLITLRNKLVFLIIYYGGLKVSDLSNLPISHILHAGDAQTFRLLIEHPKRDPYTIPMPLMFGPLYSEYLTLLGKLKASMQVEFSELLFNANPYRILSGGLSPRGLEILFEEWSKALSLKITPKGLRQAAIVRWLEHKHSDTTIKEWLGVIPSYSLKPYKNYLSDLISSQEALQSNAVQYYELN